MIILGMLFVCSVIVLPGVALLALRWALRHGEFDNLQRAALSIFDDDEPLGRMTDRFPARPLPPSERAVPEATPLPEHRPEAPGNSLDTSRP